MPDIQNTFKSDEELQNINVEITGAETATLYAGDYSMTANDDGTYTYAATYTASTDGDYTFTLNTATDDAGNDGASGQSVTVTTSSTPTGLVDDFESGISSAYTTNSGGFTVQTDGAMHGSNYIQHSTSNGTQAQLVSMPGDGLNYYPQRGDAWSWEFTTSEPSSANAGMYFGYVNASNHYYVQVDNDRLEILETVGGSAAFVSGRTMVSPLASGVQHRAEFKWDDGTHGGGTGDMTFTIYDDTGSEVDSVTGTSTNVENSTGTDGTDAGIGWFGWNNSTMLDYARLTGW